ncbi:helix-turn-helix transcriptional regulator [Parendozoicomonas haliclonae]|uniref:YheO-like PAS domain protein n=1 Tax=Parendozoicomonas haliclonae TaxID=1960125 RepID=A0A1X7AFY7_9GAMM|nr:PAS domain-containing protein [Parendozoicomonas haliclonae]SMA38643.1 YheO-like PAS domain protein [Parendozoicomonas haliclonae]
MESLSQTGLSLKVIDPELKPYCIIADFIAEFVGPHCEVVLHSLENVQSSVVYIVNGHITRRKLGAPMTDLGLKQVVEMRRTGNLITGNYFTQSAKPTSREGALFKSISCGITNPEGNLIGFLCINMNLDVPFPEIIRTMMPGLDSGTQVLDEQFNHDMDEMLETVTEQVINEVATDMNIPLKQKNRQIVHELFHRNIFQIKGAAKYIADKLNITKHSVYKYYREVKS